MTSIKRSLFVPFSTKDMFSLVNDVERYPEFLPWCSSSNVLMSDSTRMEATLSIAKGRFNYNFSTINSLREDESISIELIDGPFKNFSGLWQFTSLDSGSSVKLELDFEFNGVLLGAALSLASGMMVDTLVNAFKQRAYKIYES